MLHEILLSLSGHPSPLLTSDHSSSASILSPPERALLATVAHISDLHCRLIAHTATISTTHSSSVCRAIAVAISSTHLGKFQQKVLEVEDGILRKDSASVGAYNIVPLTAIVGEFSGWTRRLEWFLETTEFMRVGKGGDSRICSGAMVIDRLCNAMFTGYTDIEEVAQHLVKVAEMAWLKQVSVWILYGRLPTFGQDDFFICSKEGDIYDYQIRHDLLPAFVASESAFSILFIGTSLNHIRVKGISSVSSPELDLVSSHLRLLSALTFPITTAGFTRAISTIRLSLSQKTLQELLPLSRVVEILSLLREFFLLGRGEFAMALINEADEKIRSRWQRADNLAYEKRDGSGDIVVKQGEVSAVLTRTWSTMGALQGHNENEDEDELLELARDLVRLMIVKGTAISPSRGKLVEGLQLPTPFGNLLLSVPVALTLKIPSPLDLFLTPPDLETYSSINAYLLSIRRAHLRLTDLWKITSLRRDHPTPPGPPYGSSTSGRMKVRTSRERAKQRSAAMRSVWATSSAAVFFLGETEAYLQGEVVVGTWNGFKQWILGNENRAATIESAEAEAEAEEDIWVEAGRESNPFHTPTAHTHDPQTLAEAHRKYLVALSKSLLLTTPSFTEPLYYLLQLVDHLVALVYRIHSIWQSLDLEADEGVVDAFSDFHKEEKDVKEQLMVIANRVKGAIEQLIKSLRDVDQEKEGWDHGYAELVLEEKGSYVAQKVGRVDRLLMKLDFGGWFVSESPDGGDEDFDELE